MADFTAEQSFDGIDTGRMTTYLGGIVSLALIAGACVWGVKLVMRDVTGIPVVQAVDGPMRVASDDPGGVVVDNAGLSVNSVAGQGAAAAPEERVTLAPEDASFEAQDLQVAPQAATPEAAVTEALITATSLGEVTEASALAPLATAEEADVQNMIDEILAGADVAPLADPSAETAEAEAPAAPQDPNIVTIMVNGAPVETRRSASPLAVNVALRPVARKARPASTEVASRATNSPATAPVAAPAPLVAGTPLAQLGAYDAETVAATEWARFADTFPELMANLSPVVQRAQSGGKVFYRLRAQGFADVSAARRFCSALEARSTDCVPVVWR